MAGLILGIDIGTTTVKAVLVDRDGNDIIEEHSQATNAKINSTTDGGDEQDVCLIMAALENVVNNFSLTKRKLVKWIGICGQMHGVMLWKEKKRMRDDDGAIDATGTTPLVTWQDLRCNPDFLSSLPSTGDIRTGFGCASLYWYQRYRPGLLEEYDRAGTVMDFVVCALCGRGDVVMATHNAHSWGYFDPSSVKWKVDNLQDCGFLHLLPEVVSPPAVAGALIGAWCGLSEGVSVGVAMGDLQCSIKAAKPEINNAVLNIGTASQLSIINPSSTTPPLPPSLNQVPYFHGSNLIVAASLTGGNAIAGLITFFSDFLKKLGISHISEDDLYKNVLEGAMTKADTTLSISPLFLGERHQPHVRGQISNVTFDNSTYGDVGFALMKGVVDNLTDMMPPAIMEHFKIEKIIGCGSILHKNDMLTQLIKDHFTNIGISLEVKPDDVIGAPFGAAVTMTEII